MACRKGQRRKGRLETFSPYLGKDRHLTETLLTTAARTVYNMRAVNPQVERKTMSIEKLADGSLMITGDSIEVYRLIALGKALKLDAHGRKIGMKFSNRVNVAQNARDLLAANGVKPARNLDKLLAQYEKWMRDIGIFQS